MNWKIGGIVIALAVHAAVYALAVHPMLTIHSEAALAFIAPATVLYLPASLLAWVLAMATHSTEAFTGTCLVAGGVWYCLVGFWIGRRLDQKRKG